MKKMNKMSAVVGALLLGLMLTGCGNSLSPSEESTGESASVDSSSVETVEDNSLSLSENIVEQADDEENSIAVEASEDDFLAAMDACAGVWPGSAGSSLREAIAAGMLLDWTENYGDLLSPDQVKEFTRDWMESSSDDDLEYLKEAWGGIVSAMLAMAEDPDSCSDILGDAGYTLKYDSYDYKTAEAAIEAIAAVLQQ